MTISTTGIVAVAYIVAALLFVLSLAGLSKHETAKTGNTYGMVGMAIALVATIWVVFENRGYAARLRRSPWSSRRCWSAARSACGGRCASR